MICPLKIKVVAIALALAFVSSTHGAAVSGEIALKERWPLLELLAEEGRLDDVFRSITLPDTKASKDGANDAKSDAQAVKEEAK